MASLKKIFKSIFVYFCHKSKQTKIVNFFAAERLSQGSERLSKVWLRAHT